MVINGYEQLQSIFPLVWQMLSPAGVAEHRLHRFLNVGEDHALPAKLSSFLLNYPQYRYPSTLQATLRSVSELLLIDVVDQDDVESRFYHECYCESGALSQHALVSKQMLAARYAALFNPAEAAPAVTPVSEGPGKLVLTPEVMAEAISQRPIVLIGDVGVGKTSFLKHLTYVSAFKEFQNALYIYIDLGSQGALSTDLQDFVLTEIEDQLRRKHSVDITERNFVQAVYNLDIIRFERGIYRDLKGANPSLYQQKFLEFLEEKARRRDQHLKHSISHIARGRKKQTIIVLDNADQRDYEIQQAAFIIAQKFGERLGSGCLHRSSPPDFLPLKAVGCLNSVPAPGLYDLTAAH